VRSRSSLVLSFPERRCRSLAPARRSRVAARSLLAQLAPVPPIGGALRVQPNPAQNSESLHVQHPVPDRSWLPWLAMVTEPPSPTPPVSLQPAPSVRPPSSCLGLTNSRVAHVKSRVRSASPCSRSRHRATSARACVRLRAMRRRDPVYVHLPPVYPSSNPRVRSYRSPPPARRAINRRVLFARVARAVRTCRRAFYAR
jgi:hypothetical protein